MLDLRDSLKLKLQNPYLDQYVGTPTTAGAVSTPVPGEELYGPAPEKPEAPDMERSQYDKVALILSLLGAATKSKPLAALGAGWLRGRAGQRQQATSKHDKEMAEWRRRLDAHAAQVEQARQNRAQEERLATTARSTQEQNEWERGRMEEGEEMASRWGAPLLSDPEAQSVQSAVGGLFGAPVGRAAGGAARGLEYEPSRGEAIQALSLMDQRPVASLQEWATGRDPSALERAKIEKLETENEEMVATLQHILEHGYKPGTGTPAGEALKGERTAASQWGRDVGAPGSPARERETRINVIMPAQAEAYGRRGTGGGRGGGGAGGDGEAAAGYSADQSRLLNDIQQTEARLYGGAIYDELSQKTVQVPKSLDKNERAMLTRRLAGLKKRASAMGMGDAVGFQAPAPARPKATPANLKGQPLSATDQADTDAWIEANGPSAFVAQTRALGLPDGPIRDILATYRNSKGKGISNLDRYFPKPAAPKRGAPVAPGIGAMGQPRS